jgi:hypothetical protein
VWHSTPKPLAVVERQDFLARHQAGDDVEGIVTKQVPFGSFAPPQPGPG